MADELPNYMKIELGTAVVWGEAGATGVTKTLSFNNLAAAAAIMGEVADLGADWEEEHMAMLLAETGTAPTAGGTVDAYLVATDDTGRYPAKVTGSAGAYTPGTGDANLKQAGAPVVSLFATADATTLLIQQPRIWRPPARYVVPIVKNNMDQAIRNVAATDNKSRLILVPRRLFLKDTV